MAMNARSAVIGSSLLIGWLFYPACTARPPSEKIDWALLPPVESRVMTKVGTLSLMARLSISPFLLLLFCSACGFDQPPAKDSSLPASPAQGKTAASPEQGKPAPSAPSKPEPPAPQQEQQTITYATNPEKFAQLKPGEPAFNITNPRTAEEHFSVAVYADSHKQLDKAIEEYQKALELKPGWAIAHFRLAKDYDKKGRTDDAIAHWELATRYDPQFYLAYDFLAAAYQRQGNLKKAVEAYSALLKYPPAGLPAHYQLGLWYAELGDRQKAREHLESYRKLALNSKERESPRFQKAISQLRKLKQ